MNKQIIKRFGILITVIWILSSSTIIGNIYNGSKGVSITKNPDVAEDNLLVMSYSLGKIEMEDNIFNTVKLDGWGLCPSSEREKDQTISILLMSKNKQYEISTEVYGRTDLPGFMKRKGYNIQTGLHGFTVAFCPYPFSDGEYNISILCKENEKIVGKETTDYILEKKRGEIEIREWISEIVTDIDFTEPKQGNIRMAVDYTGVMGENFLIKGWMYLNEEIASTSKKYAQVITVDHEPVIYEMSSYSRVDLCSIVDENIARTAGFDLKIPIAELRDYEKIEILFYIVRDGKVYMADPGQTVTYNLEED